MFCYLTMSRSLSPSYLLLSVSCALLNLQVAYSQSPTTNRSSLKYEHPTNITATIYAIDSERKVPLFTFIRQANRIGDRLKVLREYKYPDGRLAARETAVYQGDTLLSWKLDELQIHARGSAVLQQAPAGGRLLFEYDKNIDDKSAPKRRSEDVRQNTLACDMVGPFLLDHWDALMRGDEVKCRYLVVPRTETVGFTFEKLEERKREGKDVVIIKMSASSPIIAALVDPLYFTIEKGGQHRVLEYRGRTAPRLKSGSKWKELDAVTVFDW
jgi:hypothetical protein